MLETTEKIQLIIPTISENANLHHNFFVFLVLKEDTENVLEPARKR